MNQQATREQLKVDSIAIQQREEGHGISYLVIYNINIPAAIIYNDQERRNVLERARRLLMNDFGNLDIRYQVTASYYLRNSITGAQQTWTGSFFARHNSLAQLSGFRAFDNDSFVQTTFQATQGQDVEANLRWNTLDTAWKFEALLSIIINVQCSVPTGHKTVARRNLSVKTFKNRQTFALP
jgi:hypothetical protein